ncbi:hypothetical protein BJV77DRAFT_1032385 [Russula vinacea]|nr:hypothetical protein BJV77DRAFT_1032385 [Russula vinacea]
MRGNCQCNQTFSVRTMVRLNTLWLSFTIASLSILRAWSQSPPTPSPCVQTCSDSSAQSAGCSSTDVNCICDSDTFANDVSTCIVLNCSTTDAEAAVGYFEALCSGASSSSFVTFSGMSSTESVSATTSGSGSVTNTASSSESSFGSSSSSSSPSFSGSGLSTPTNPAEQSTVSPTTTTGSSESSKSVHLSSVSFSLITPSITPPVSHAVRGHTAGSFVGAGFALVLAIALVAW